MCGPRWVEEMQVVKEITVIVISRLLVIMIAVKKQFMIQIRAT